MKELIDERQAHLLMVAVLLAAPLVGLLWGAWSKRPVRVLLAGLLVGVGNYGLWTMYNAITDRLGLDTVKNLAVNLALFVAVGIGVGLAYGRWSAREQGEESEP